MSRVKQKHAAVFSQPAPGRDMHFISMVPMGVHRTGPRSWSVHYFINFSIVLIWQHEFFRILAQSTCA